MKLPALSNRLLTPLLAGLLLGAGCPGPPTKPDMAEDLAGRADLSPGPDLTGGADMTGGAMTLRGFNVPESAYWDAASGAWYVSNIVGNPAMKDGQGWISKVSADGTAISEEKWVTGLNAPKGMRAAGGKLYVSDIDQLVIITIADKTDTKVTFTGAMFLNDVAVAEDGYVYVTDSIGNSVWRWKSGGNPERWVQDASLNVPNGLLLDGGKLIVVSTGPFDQAANLGKIWTLDVTNKALAALGTFEAKLDGIEKDGAGFLLSDNPTARVLRVGADGTSSTVLRDLKAADGHMSAADIGFDPARRLVAVPDLATNAVTFFRIP
jgi:sugar lactone lactonase YvrE